MFECKSNNCLKNRLDVRDGGNNKYQIKEDESVKTLVALLRHILSLVVIFLGKNFIFFVLGVPATLRGKVWTFLHEQWKLHHTRNRSVCSVNPTSFQQLLKELTPHQHAILIDLGKRTIIQIKIKPFIKLAVLRRSV